MAEDDKFPENEIGSGLSWSSDTGDTGLVPLNSDIDDEIDDDEEDFVVSSDERLTADEEVKASTIERMRAADSLRRWADSENPENVAILRRLEADLRAGNRLNEWATFALEDLLRPPRQDSEDSLLARLAAIVIFLRNLFLFLPVALTWIAIDKAADAYTKFAGSGTTFLQAWQQKVEALPIIGKPTLGHIALLDFWIIAALIVLTAFGQVLEIAADKQTRASDLQRDLAFRNVIIEVGLFLHGFRQITPAALKGGLSEAVNQLAQATTAIKDTLLDVREVSSSAADTLANFSRIAVGEFEPAARRLDQIVQSLGSAAETHKGLGDLVRNLQRDMGLSLEKMKEGMDGLGVVLDSRLSDNTVKLEQALRGIIRETEGAASGLRDAAVAAGEVARVMKKQAEAI